MATNFDVDATLDADATKDSPSASNSDMLTQIKLMFQNESDSIVQRLEKKSDLATQRLASHFDDRIDNLQADIDNLQSSLETLQRRVVDIEDSRHTESIAQRFSAAASEHLNGSFLPEDRPNYTGERSLMRGPSISASSRFAVRAPRNYG